MRGMYRYQPTPEGAGWFCIEVSIPDIRLYGCTAGRNCGHWLQFGFVTWASIWREQSGVPYGYAQIVSWIWGRDANFSGRFFCQNGKYGYICTRFSIFTKSARMAESVDALVSNTSRFTPVPVRPRLRVRCERLDICRQNIQPFFVCLDFFFPPPCIVPFMQSTVALS